MPRVRVSIQDLATYICVAFIDRQQQVMIGPVRRFSSPEMVMDMLRRTPANAGLLNRVERELAEHRSVMIDLHLTDEQFAAIQTRGPKV
jgi:hypothetical protein